MFGEELSKAGKQLIDDPYASLFDVETLCNSVRDARSKTDRYRELIENKEVKQKELLAWFAVCAFFSLHLVCRRCTFHRLQPCLSIALPKGLE